MPDGDAARQIGGGIGHEETPASSLLVSGSAGHRRHSLRRFLENIFWICFQHGRHRRNYRRSRGCDLFFDHNLSKK